MDDTNIPSEIFRFFSLEEGQTLLVKGFPGTGKTTLAFEIMNALCEEKNGMYISTRVDPKRLFATFPWMKDTIPSKNVINATQAKLTSSLREWMDKLEGAATYDSVLGFFKLLFDEAEETENPMIVIDSWDAMMNYTAHIIGGARQSFEQNMCEFARDLGIHLIFVSEFAELMPLDYIVDGVVTMEQIKLLGGGTGDVLSRDMRARYAREIRLDKLRGVEIKQRSYTCTLHGGRFRYFEPYQEQGETRIKGAGNRIPDPAEDCISTGVPDLDRIITPLKYGSCNVMEIGQGVGKRYYQILTALASNALRNGRGVFLLPSIGYQIQPQDVYVPSNMVVRQAQGDDLEAWVRELIGAWDELRDRTGHPLLNIMGMDAAEFAFGYKEVLNMSNRLASKWKEKNDISLLVVKTGQESINMIIHAADTYFVVKELNGGLCLYGVIPRTEPYYLTIEGPNKIYLTPIV